MTTTDAVHVDDTNREQLHAWDGDEGAYWAGHPAQFDRSVAPYHAALMAAAAVGHGDRVLDVGCGTGEVALDAARLAPAGHALGVDLSRAMLDVARRRAADAHVSNVTFEQADAQIHHFDTDAFDIALSRTGAMFFGDKLAAFRNIARGLRPGGRLLLVTWQPLPENEWLQEFSAAMAAERDLPAAPPDAPGPFSLADPDHLRALLAGAGYTDVTVDGMVAPMWFGDDAADAFDLVFGLLGWMLEGVDEAGRAHAEAALRASVAAHETPDGVCYRSAAWITQAVRV